jgi:CRISPR/Cas system-associated exonuclease Cas4 (RecB family)
MRLTPSFILSQASLQDYADCQRRFQLRYVSNALWPMAPPENTEWESRALQGAAFHQLAHQHALGISTKTLGAAAVEQGLQHWWESYLTVPPPDLPSERRRSEVYLSMPVDPFRLVARYDLLTISPGRRAAIVDWKTTSRRPARAWLSLRWQTRVYRYVLSKAGAPLNDSQPFAPEQIELIYWFANFPHQIERFPYDANQQAQEERVLLQLIGEIAAHDPDEWPLTADLQRCQYCRYRTYCGREKMPVQETEDDPDQVIDFDLDLEQIAEIEF